MTHLQRVCARKSTPDLSCDLRFNSFPFRGGGALTSDRVNSCSELLFLIGTLPIQGGGALTSDIVEGQIRRALSWCEPRQEVLDRRIAAVTLLRELAEQAPAVFNVHVKVRLSGGYVMIAGEGGRTGGGRGIVQE
jgi:hypothetical protein